MDLTAFLDSLMTVAGINAAVMFVFSFVVEWFPAWENVEPKLKRAVMIVLSFAFPLAAMLLQGRYDTASLWLALSAGFAAFMANQVAATRKL